MDICKPKSGETLVVTAAAGAVGSTVCQVGKIKGITKFQVKLMSPEVLNFIL